MNSKQAPTRTLKWILVLILTVLSAGCGTSIMKTPNDFIKEYGFQNTQRSLFTLCYGYGCPETVNVTLSNEDWQPIRDIFSPEPKDAASERERIAKAIQALERITGEKTGINTDIGGTFTAMLRSNQMDCEDEAVNTNIFLLLLQQDNLLKFHRTYGISRRGMMFVHWPHMATSIIDTATQEIFVVDSWFFDHAMPVHIVPEKEWLSFWKPEESEYDKYHDQPVSK